MNDVVIRPLRFTDDVPAMRAFLERLGLRPRIESETGVWVELLAGRGMVALHDAASSSTGGRHGQTNLAFEAADIEQLRDKLESAGYDDATVFDEAFGRVLSLTGPDGMEMWIDERSKDLYGYKRLDSPGDERWQVTPYLTGANQQAWEVFLDLIGAEPRPLFGRPEAGWGVRLDLRTTENLDDVLQRMSTAGHAATRTDAGLEIVDPDGQTVVVHG